MLPRSRKVHRCGARTAARGVVTAVPQGVEGSVRPMQEPRHVPPWLGTDSRGLTASGGDDTALSVIMVAGYWRVWRLATEPRRAWRRLVGAADPYHWRTTVASPKWMPSCRAGPVECRTSAGCLGESTVAARVKKAVLVVEAVPGEAEHRRRLSCATRRGKWLSGAGHRTVVPSPCTTNYCDAH